MRGDPRPLFSHFTNSRTFTIGGKEMGWIYKITNQINGKMYIGKTEGINPLDRWKQHLLDSRRKKLEKRPLYYAIRKYGTDSFLFEVIDQEDNSEKLCELEKYYIEKYRTYVGFENSAGYNATLGGDGKSYIKLDENEVILVHISNNYIAGITAKHFNVDVATIQKILKKHNIRWLSNNEITELRFRENYGGIIQIDKEKLYIEYIYDSPIKVLNKYSEYNKQTLLLAYTKNSKTHYAYGHYWYRLNELPEEYKPLLDDYYKNK